MKKNRLSQLGITKQRGKAGSAHLLHSACPQNCKMREVPKSGGIERRGKSVFGGPALEFWSHYSVELGWRKSYWKPSVSKRGNDVNLCSNRKTAFALK